MRRLLQICICLSLLGFVSQVSVPFLNSQTAKAQEKTESPEKKVRKKPRGRVPNHYGKLGLSIKQKETIYAIQEKYRVQLDALENQIEILENEEATEVEEVLTSEQKASLVRILEEINARKSSTDDSSED